MTGKGEINIGLQAVHALRRSGVLPVERYFDALLQVRDPVYWRTWALRTLLALGAGHLLAGMVFFFAYNWDDLPVFARFGIIQAGIVAAVAAALTAGPDRPFGQALLIAASVLTGVLLAVIGQVYQTGADAWELFATWAVLILPWTLASRSAAHWLLWLLVACLALFLCGRQLLLPLGWLTDAELLVLLGMVCALALIAREMACHAGVEWLTAPWTRAVVATAALVLLFIPATGYVLDLQDQLVGLLVFIAGLAAALATYARWLRDDTVVTLGVAFGAFFLMALGGRVLHETIGLDGGHQRKVLVSLGLLVLWCILVTVYSLRLINLLPGPSNGREDD